MFNYLELCDVSFDCRTYKNKFKIDMEHFVTKKSYNIHDMNLIQVLYVM